MGACLSGHPEPIVYQTRRLPGPYEQQAVSRPTFRDTHLDAPLRPSTAPDHGHADVEHSTPTKPQHARKDSVTPPADHHTPKADAQQQWQWRKLGALGKGAYGSVCLGITHTGKLMAIKQVEKPVACDEATRKKLLESTRELEGEIVTLQKLSHPNIVKYYGCERTDTHINIFLEWVPGGSIRKLLDDFGPLEEPIVRVYAEEVLKGLQYLHSKRIMHRDIKGQNVLVDACGAVKLADFGASKQIHTVIDSVSHDDQVNCSVKGTPYFMAPEVVQGVGHNRKADIWSLGCLVFEMLTAKLPWAEQIERNHNAFRAMMYIANHEGNPTLPATISAEAKDFLAHCWERNPLKRASCDSLLEHPFIAGGRPPPETPEPGHQRVHPSVGTFPSPIQEEGQGYATPLETPDGHGASFAQRRRESGRLNGMTGFGPALAPRALPSEPQAHFNSANKPLPHGSLAPDAAHRTPQKGHRTVLPPEPQSPAAMQEAPAHRPATAQAGLASPREEGLPSRPYTAGALAAPVDTPELETSATPEVAAEENVAPDAAEQRAPAMHLSPAWRQSVTSFNPMMSYQLDLMGGDDDEDTAASHRETAALPSLRPVAEDTSAPGENEQPAERKVLALHRQSLAQSVSKLLADAGALDEFNNLSNPLFGTQQSVTRSQAGFGLQMPAAQGADLPVPGAPLSPISENTNSRQWTSSGSLRYSRDPSRLSKAPSAQLESKLSGRPRTADTGGDALSGRIPAGDLQQRPSTADVLRTGPSTRRPAPGEDLDVFMEQMLSKERSAFREQRQSQSSGRL